MASMCLHVFLPLFMYFFIFVSGFIVSISLGITKNNLNGCPLYMNFYDAASGNHFAYTGGSESTCGFVMYLPIITDILYGCAMVIFYLYVLYRLHREDQDIISYRKRFTELILNILLCLLEFAAACITSVGRSHLCSSYLNLNFRPDSCFNFERTQGINSDKALQLTILAEVTLWVSLIWWTVLVIYGAVNLRKLRQAAS